jgi:hypothetical protein
VAKLSDNQAHDRLVEARRALGDDAGLTKRADTALKAARQALTGLATALLIASETDSDEVPGVKDRDAI